MTPLKILEDFGQLLRGRLGVEPEDVHVGMPVRVVFEHNDDVWIPLFTPEGAEGAEAGS